MIQITQKLMDRDRKKNSVYQRWDREKDVTSVASVTFLWYWEKVEGLMYRIMWRLTILNDHNFNQEAWQRQKSLESVRLHVILP